MLKFLYTYKFSGLIVVIWLFSSIVGGIFDVFYVASHLHFTSKMVPGWWLWAGIGLTIMVVLTWPPDEDRTKILEKMNGR